MTLRPVAGAPRPKARSEGATLALGLGRRKCAVARVRLLKGEGAILINGRPMEQYFLSERQRLAIAAPLKVAKGAKFDVRVNVQGGGLAGQAGATQLGIAKALRSLSEENGKILRAQGLLTTDAREKERRKYGHAKARKSYQYSKR